MNKLCSLKIGHDTCSIYRIKMNKNPFCSNTKFVQLCIFNLDKTQIQTKSSAPKTPRATTVNTCEPPRSVQNQTARYRVQPGPNAFAQQFKRAGAQVALEDRRARGQQLAPPRHQPRQAPAQLR
jgi:hypothetical protein